MAEKKDKIKILVIDDNPTIGELFQHIFDSSQFHLEMGHSGKDGLAKTYSFQPDLIILDVSMDQMDGYEVCARLKNDATVRHIPIIMVTVRSRVEEKIRGLNIGADDYITKPFDDSELLARVKMLLRRSKESLQANPLTRLPGNIVIAHKVEEKIKSRKKFAVCYIDLDNFKAFNDYYGYECGDSVLQYTGSLILKHVQKHAFGKSFLGHIGGDDFLAIVPVDVVKKVCEEVIEAFDRDILSFYSEEDRQRGYIETENRQNKKVRFPMISITMCVVTNQFRDFSHTGEISTLATELKKYAKKLPGSNYVINKRTK